MANHGHEYAQNDKQQKNGERDGISRGDREMGREEPDRLLEQVRQVAYRLQDRTV